MKLTLKELQNYLENTIKISYEKIYSVISKRSFIKTDKQIFSVIGIVFAVSVLALLSYWIFKERPYYHGLLTEKDELIETLKLTSGKQKKMYENTVSDYEKKLANEYVLRSVYDDKANYYEQKLNLYQDTYISQEDHINQIKQLKQQLKKKSDETSEEDTPKKGAEENITTLVQKISILEDKNLGLETAFERSVALLKGEKETWEDMLLLERRKAFIPSLILPETRNNTLNEQVVKRLVALKDKLKNIEKLPITLSPDTYFEMGLISYYNKQYEEAIEQWEEAISLNKDNLKAYICLAIVYHETGMSENAIKILRHAAETHPAYSTLHLSLARIYEQKDALDHAIYEYSKVLEISPQIIDIHHTLGVLYEKKGLKKEAKKSFARYEKLNKENKQE